MTGFWSTVIGKWVGVLLAAATIALVTGTWTHLSAFWEVQAAVEEIKEGEIKHQETLDDILEALKSVVASQEEMKGQYEEIKVIILTPEITGRATIGNFGFDDAFVDINERGSASMYLGADSILVTCEVNGTTFSIELPVRGSFRNREDVGHLVILSAKAGSDLGARTGSIIDKFTVGPVKR